jgi:hypothetical protein
MLATPRISALAKSKSRPGRGDPKRLRIPDLTGSGIRQPE